MSASSTPKGTPVQRSPSDGLPEDAQSPQHSTPGSGAQQKSRISSLLQSPVRGASTVPPQLCASCGCFTAGTLSACVCAVLSGGAGRADPGADEEGGQLVQPVGAEAAGRLHGHARLPCGAAGLTIK